MGKQFRASVAHEAEILGCDEGCFHNGITKEWPVDSVVKQCCKDGVIRVNYGEVNTIGIVE
jgi:hypothetical protein